VAGLHLRPATEQGVRPVQQQNPAGGIHCGDLSAPVLFRLADVGAHEPGEIDAQDRQAEPVGDEFGRDPSGRHFY
jgi:hypothetical protein